jgi:hypothetical protein
VYQILKDDGPKYRFSLVPHKTSLWWWTMDCVRLRLLFYCRLDTDENDLPLPGRPCGLASRLRRLCEAAPHCEEH